ncbi:MAG: 3-dehydroquinate synthase [Lautropia sp.]|nr:3-dehydroquinate synthase [Lautropia sp.]
MSRPQILNVDLGQRSYKIQVGQGLIDRNPALQALVQDRSVAIVSDSHVDPLYGERIERLLSQSARRVIRIVVPAGEASKCWQQLDAIHDQMLVAHLDRKSLLVALGGGVVGDLGGFAAASFQRGIDFVQVPTSLLAQVDSSVGGKTGINHARGKNMVGAFHQPRLVVADTDTLQTLPSRELAAGLAEVIKHGAIADRGYLQQVAQDMPDLLKCQPDALARAILTSIQIKAAVVAADEREAGVRAHLNFGHTFGHAIEVGAGYGKWLHGEAVAAGMVMAADLSVRLGRLSGQELDTLTQIIAGAGLPVRAPAWPVEDYLKHMSIDKKAENGTPVFVVLNGLGHACTTRAEESLVRSVIAAHLAAD